MNDGYGHLFGDEILKIIADKISQNVTPDDVAARIGGDEFLLFVKFEKDIEGRIEGIFEILAANKQAFRVSVSMGVAVIDGKNVRYETLFHQGGSALYASKRAGRGTYRIYDESMCNMFSGALAHRRRSRKGAATVKNVIRKIARHFGRCFYFSFSPYS